MSRAFNLRYTLTRVRMGLEEAIAQLNTTTASVPEALSKGMQALVFLQQTQYTIRICSVLLCRV